MSSSNDITIRQHVEKDIPKISKLLNNAFGKWPERDLQCLPVEHYRWKYVDNPQSKRNIVVAETKDQLIGCDHDYFLNVKLGGEIYSSTQGTDTAVHPDYQGKGVYKRLAERKKEYRIKQGKSFSYWITDNPIFLDYAKRMKRQRLPYPLLNLLKVQDIQLHAKMTNTKKSTLKSLGYTLKKAASSLRYSKINRDTIEFTIKPVKAFDERADIFWEQVKDDYSFIVERKKEYLNYRYCDSRAGYYRAIIAEGNDSDILGYAVFMINPNREYPTGNILDLLTKKNRLDVACALIKEITEIIQSQGINVLRAWALDNTGLLDAYRRNRFVISITNPPGIFFNFNKMSNEYFIHKIGTGMTHIQMGDTEWM